MDSKSKKITNAKIFHALNSQKTRIAKLDPAFSKAMRYMFKPRGHSDLRTTRSNSRVEVIHRTRFSIRVNDDIYLTLKGPVLSVYEQTVLLGLIADFSQLNINPETGDFVWNVSYINQDSDSYKAIRVREHGNSPPPMVERHITNYRLAKICNIANGGANKKRLNKALEELSDYSITVSRVAKNPDGSHRLDEYGNPVNPEEFYKTQLIGLSGAREDRTIAINSVFTAAIANGQRFLTVSMDERTQLTGDITKWLHAYLSASMDPGKQSVKRTYAKILNRLYGNAPRRDLKTKAIKDALLKLRDVNWTVELFDDYAMIARPHMFEAQPIDASRGAILEQP